MMTRTNMLFARAGASAIAAALALSPTLAAAAPTPIVDLSKSPALSGKDEAAAPAKSSPATPMIGPVDQRTAEIGGGALAVLALGAGAFAVSRSRRRRREEAEWDENEAAEHDPLFDEPMFHHEPPAMEDRSDRSEASAFAWDRSPKSDEAQADGRRRGESWVERAYRGPSPDNPSLSLRKRLKRAAFFDKREREAAAGQAAPVEGDAGLPETMVEERQLEAA